MPKMTTREKIIVAAIRMFSKRGFSGTSTSEIAKEAGCAEGTIFRYFPKKIDLLKHVAQEFIKQFAGGIATKTLYKLLEDSENMTAEELVEALIRDRIKLVDDNLEILKIVIYEINFHEEVKALFLEEFKENLLSVGLELSGALSKKLDMDDLDIYLILRTMFGQIAGILVQLHLIEPNRDRQEVLDGLIGASAKVIIHGLKGMA